MVVGARLTPATGTAERKAALALVDRLGAEKQITVGMDKAYDAREFVADLRERKVTPHIAKNELWTRTAPCVEALSMAARHGMQAMASACVDVSASKRSSAGSRPSACCVRHAIAALTGWAGRSLWPLPPMNPAAKLMATS
ncbi:hypothetical protein CK216_18765 [Mesorhizobium sp. WSM3876]|nr:hypothetical protein CK216_18765 [Mesorhizobium sp. WSM3876]RWF20164.1 MAG: hypothetical protein EOS64_18170 [Mesorhizobium sp.]